jgi:hypothetical protein
MQKFHAAWAGHRILMQRLIGSWTGQGNHRQFGLDLPIFRAFTYVVPTLVVPWPTPFWNILSS